MKLTIWIPVYNWWDLLIDTIKSCKKIWLDDLDYEILVIDNCSTDNSIDKVYSLQKEIPSLRLVENTKNYWRIWNWNRVLEEAQWDYILFLMVWDLLEKLNYKELFLWFEKDTCYVFSFYQWKKDILNTHWAFKLNEKIPLENIRKLSLQTFGNNFWLPPLQSHFFRKDILIKNNIKFDKEIPFLADLKFLNEYVSYFKNIKFLDIANIIWWTGLWKFTFKSQLFMFRDFLSYYPWAFNKYLKRDINMFFFKSYLTLHVFFIYINNFRIWNKGFTFWEMLWFIKKDLWSIFYILVFIFEPFYIVYMFINFKTNFKYVIKF